MIVPIFLATALPIVKRAATGMLVRYTIVRPNVSLSGAARTGPKESPKQYMETPSRDTVVDTPKYAATSFVPEEYMEAMKVLVGGEARSQLSKN